MLSNRILNIFNNPKNAGRIMKPDGIASIYNEDNTANVEFSLRVDSGIILECQFRAQANPYIVAICSTITEMVKGKMASMLFLDPVSVKKQLGDEQDIDIDFCVDCVKLAVQDYKDKLEKLNKESKGKRSKKLESEEDKPSENSAEQVADEVTDEETEDDDINLFDDEVITSVEINEVTEDSQPEISTDNSQEDVDEKDLPKDEDDDGFPDDDFINLFD